MNTTFRLLSFLIAAKSRNYLYQNKKLSALLLNILILIVFSVNIYILCHSLNDMYMSGDQNRIRFTENSLFFSLILIPVLNLFFPSFRYPVRIFKPSDPIIPALQYFIRLIYTFISPVYILLLLGAITLYAFTPFSFQNLLLSFILIFISNLIVVTIQSLILSNWKSRIYALCIVLLFGGILYIFHLDPLSIAGSGILVISLLLIELMMKRINPIEVSYSHSGNVKSNSQFAILIKIFFKTVVIRPNLALAICFKTVFLLLLLSKPFSINPLYTNLLRLMLVSPLIYFTYIHNNLWGYLTTTYKSLSITRNISAIFRSYFVIVSFVTAIDMLLTFAVIAYSDQYVPLSITTYLSFYVLTFFILTFIGFYASLSEPIEVKKSFNFSSLKSNTSLPFNLLGMAATLLTAYLILDPERVYFLSIPVLLVVYLFYMQIVRGKITANIRNVFNAI